MTRLPWILVIVLAGTIGLWELSNLSQRSRPGLRQQAFRMNFVSVSGILRADFSSLDYSNNTIVTGDAFGGLNLWAYTSARKVEFKSTTRSNTSSNTNDEVTQVELFENETRCAQLNSNPRRLLMHSTKNGSLSKQFEISADFLRFAVSNDSKRLVTVSGNRLQVWNITDNSLDLLFTNTTNDSTLYQNVDVSPDGKYVASGNRDKVVLFNVTSPSKLDYLNVANQLKSEQNYFNVKFLPNDTHLATTNGAYLMHWQYNDTTLRIRANIRLSGPIFTLAVSPSGKYIMCNNKQMLDFFEVYKFELTNQKESTAHFAREVVYTQNNQSLSVYDKALSAFTIDYTATNASDVIKTSTDYFINSPNHFGQVYTVAAGPNGYVVSSSWDSENLKLWRINKNSLELLQSESVKPSIFSVTDMKLTATDISPNGLHVATAGSNPFDIIMFSLNGSKLQNKTHTTDNSSHIAQVTAIKFTNDSTHLVSTGLDNKILLWQIVQKKDLAVVAYNSVNRSGFTGFQLSRNSQFIVASHNPNPNNSIANISIWNIDYSKKKITLVNETRNSEAHNADILCMTISPDEKYLASMGANGILKFWRLENYTMADQLQAYPVGLTGQLLFSSDGQFLIVALLKNNLLFTYGPTGLILESNTTRTFNPSDPYSITQDSQSKTIIIGQTDGSLKLYNIA